MPLRDHFHPPVSTRRSWEGFHGLWPAMILQRLAPLLPDGYSAEPRIHLGPYYEIDVAALEDDDRDGFRSFSGGSGGTATAAWAPPEPTLMVDSDLLEQYEYEVRVFDDIQGRKLVAAIELVSPANKDRPEHRRAFVAKVATLLQQGVCVSVVDVVTSRSFNLYADLLDLIGRIDPSLDEHSPDLYAVTTRMRTVEGRGQFHSWSYPLELGQPLPTLPLWLQESSGVPIDLEGSYEDTCRVLRIG